MRITAIAGSGIGGTEKAASLFAAELSRRGHQVEMLTDTSGPRAPMLIEAGVKLHDAPLIGRSLLNYLNEFKPDVIHQHVSGYWKDNPIYEILGRLGQPPYLVETNVFGRLEDPKGEQWVDRRFFISAASGCQAFRRSGRKLSREKADRNWVSYYPLEKVSPLNHEERRRLRSELKVSDHEILAIRVGRPSNKWSDWEMKGVQQSRSRGCQIKLLAMEPSEILISDISSGKYGNGIIVRKATSDFAYLTKLYQAADLMIHASEWGESFGYTIAEGMQAALPVITRTTPWGDNAQVELVENGKTGYVCSTVAEMARRLVELTSSPVLRQRMGSLGQERIEMLSSLKNETDILEGILEELLTGNRQPQLDKRRNLLSDFDANFSRLQADCSEPMWTHPLDHFGGAIYKRYRCLRSGLRSALNRMNRS